ncbi:MAG: hypothetical protein RI958_2165 [Actinomycetota bacterium]
MFRRRRGWEGAGAMECHRVARHVRAAFDASCEAPSRMRAVARAALANGSSELRADVEIAVSELVSNVVEHAGTAGTLTVTTYGESAVLVMVSDNVTSWGRRQRRSRPGDPVADGPVPGGPIPGGPIPGGRGLGIVDALADEWDVDRGPRGKVVWAYFNRSGVAGHESPTANTIRSGRMTATSPRAWSRSAESSG